MRWDMVRFRLCLHGAAAAAAAVRLAACCTGRPYRGRTAPAASAQRAAICSGTERRIKRADPFAYLYFGIRVLDSFVLHRLTDAPCRLPVRDITACLCVAVWLLFGIPKSGAVLCKG